MGFYSYFLLGQILGVQWEDTENKLISIQVLWVPMSHFKDIHTRRILKSHSVFKKSTSIIIP